MVRVRIAILLRSKTICEYMDFEEAASGEYIMKALQSREGSTQGIISKLYKRFRKTLCATSDVVVTAIIAPLPVRSQWYFDFLVYEKLNRYSLVQEMWRNSSQGRNL